MLSNKCERLLSDNKRTGTFSKWDISINVAQQKCANLKVLEERIWIIEDVQLHFPPGSERENLVQTESSIRPITNNAVRLIVELSVSDS